MKEEYDPKKLFEVDVKSHAEVYHSREPLISLNTKSGALSFNKMCLKTLSVEGLNKSKVRFLCDGFKLYIDSAVEANDKNYINITKNNVACSMALCRELKKHYQIEDNYKGIFKIVEVEKYRYRLELKEKRALSKKEPLNNP